MHYVTSIAIKFHSSSIDASVSPFKIWGKIGENAQLESADFEAVGESLSRVGYNSSYCFRKKKRLTSE